MRGASALQSLLETYRDPEVQIFIVWEPVLATDLSAPSTMTLRRVSDLRVRQYWDPDRVLSRLMGEHDPGSVVWDYVGVYKPGQRWDNRPPKAIYEGFPVVRAIEGTGRALGVLSKKGQR